MTTCKTCGAEVKVVRGKTAVHDSDGGIRCVGSKEPAIEVDLTDYTSSHGRNPGGRGAWAFCFDDQNPDDVANAWWAKDERGDASMPFRDARKLALAEARRRGASVVKVLA